MELAYYYSPTLCGALTIIIVVLLPIASGENVVDRTDPFRLVGLQWLHLEFVTAADLRYSALYVALAIVTHPHRLGVHRSSREGAEQKTTQGWMKLTIRSQSAWGGKHVN